MFGVVLWSDTKVNKAVIWCEDHGDLAYFSGTQDACDNRGDDSLFGLDAGDLVHFDLREGEQLRHARNPRRLEQGQHAALGELLRDRIDSECPPKQTAQPRVANSAQIIPFSRKDDCPTPENCLAV